MKPTTIRPVDQRLRYINMMLYGIPGIGKTLLLGSSPKCLVLECGTGETDTIAVNHLPVDVWEIGGEAQLGEAYEYVRHEGVNDYQWVWIDGITPLEGRLMKENMQIAVAKNPNRTVYVPDKREYLLTQSAIDRYVSLFVDLPIHVGFTAHIGMYNIGMLDADGDKEERQMMMPLIQGGGDTGKLSQKVCSYMNVVAFMDSVEVKKLGSDDEEDTEEVPGILVKANARCVAKDRFYAIGNKKGWMLRPTIPKIEAAVQGKLSGMPHKAAGAKKARKSTKKTVAKKSGASKAAGLRTR